MIIGISYHMIVTAATTYSFKNRLWILGWTDMNIKSLQLNKSMNCNCNCNCNSTVTVKVSKSLYQQVWCEAQQTPTPAATWRMKFSCRQDLSAAMDKKCCHPASANEMSICTGSDFDNKQIDLWPADPFTRIDRKCNQVVPWSLHTFPENFMQIGPAVFS